MNLAVRSLLGLGSILLFTVQAVANLAQAYLHGLKGLPSAQLSLLWGTTPRDVLTCSSILFGCALNVVGIIYYVAFARMLRIRAAELENRKERLRFAV